jgi:hypothetical protein
MDDHSWDILAEIQTLIAEIPQITTKWRHIPCHQDDKKRKKPLDIWAERNILMDARATMLYHHIPADNTPSPTFNKVLPLTINGLPIVCNFQDRIRKATVGVELLAYWKTKGKVGTAECLQVSWSALEKARALLPQKRQHWLVKHTSGACSVGKEMLKRKAWTHSKCPRCPAIRDNNTRMDLSSRRRPRYLDRSSGRASVVVSNSA